MRKRQRVLEEIKARIECLPRLRVEFGGSEKGHHGLVVVPECLVRAKVLNIVQYYLDKAK